MPEEPRKSLAVSPNELAKVQDQSVVAGAGGPKAAPQLVSEIQTCSVAPPIDTGVVDDYDTIEAGMMANRHELAG